MPTHKSDVSFEDSLLSLRFIGDELEYRSVPIYELGTTLIAVQRIINKAYLFNHDRLDKAARPSEREREEVALQIASRRKASDGYGLIPIISNPIVAPLIVLAVKQAVSAMLAYAQRSVLEDRKGNQPANQTLIVAIYPEVRQLAERVGGTGKVSALEIANGNASGAETLLFEAETKSYVRDVEKGNVLGVKSTLRGFVKRLHLDTLAVEIRARGRMIKVRVKAEDFVILQEQARSHKTVIFTGHPVFRLGDDTTKFKYFTADKFEFA